MDPASPPPPAPRPHRIDAVDWLRGLAVVLMIRTHLFDAWASPAAKASAAYQPWNHLDGIPARLFLLLVGVSMAIRFEAQIASHADRATIVRGVVRRGLQILGMAYLFRLQEYVLGGFGAHWSEIFRVDILNCIGASMIVIAPLVAPRAGRRQIAATLLAAGIVVALGSIVGPARIPGPLPRALTAYVGGATAMNWFPLFPWAAWPLVGVALGHHWARPTRRLGGHARAFVITGIAGAALMGAVILVRRIDPQVIRYPSSFVQQMGPGTFLHQLGLIGVLALLAFVASRQTSRFSFSMMRQLGRTSLLVYWIHVELCYGLLFRRLHHRLSLPEATISFVLMTGAMLLISVLVTKYWRGWPHRAPAAAGISRVSESKP